MVIPGTDAADTVDNARHFFYWPSLAELLKAAQGEYVKLRVVHVSRVIQLYYNPGMAFDSGNRLYVNGFSHLLYLHS